MKRNKKVVFTGERMIPEVNFGATFYYEHINRYQFASQFVRGRKVLDLACGSGYGSHMLFSAGASKVIGIDISKDAVFYAQKKYSKKNIEFRVSDALKTGLSDASIDVVVCFEFIEHIAAQDNLLREIKRVLRPEGILIMSTPNKVTYTDDNKFHKKELRFKEFSGILAKYFKNVEVLGQFFWFSNFITKQELEFAKEGVLPPYNEEHSQYFVALCSDKNLGKVNASFVASANVDGMDVSRGIQPLGKLFSNLMGQVSELKRELGEITSSKTYRVWQFYCHLRDSLLK